MDTITLVENQIDDGERLLERLGEHGIAVRAAGWAKPAGDDRWFFYIATPLVDEQGPLAAYKEVYRVLRSMHGAWIRDSEIKLVGDRHPVSKDLVNLVSRYPGPTSTISHRAILGDLQVDEIYVYAEPELKGYAEMKRLFPSAQIFAVAVRGGHDAAEVFSKARPLVGKVNAAEFEGKEPESLLLMGPKGPTTEPQGKLLFVYRPEGWNTFYRSGTKSWEKVVHSGTGKPIYEAADFSPLSDLKISSDE